jgi:AcrR family transcriptional regulator
MTRPENPELIAAIRKAVAELVTARGPAAVTMREVASRCGVTPTTIYYYYENKERLFEAAKFDIIDEMDRYFMSHVNEDDPPKKQLADLMKAFVEWYIANKNLADLLFEKLPPETNLTEESMEHYYRAHMRGERIIRRAKESGELAIGDPEIDTCLGLSFMYGLVKLFCEKRFPPRFWDDINPLVSRMTEIFLSALSPRDANK